MQSLWLLRAKNNRSAYILVQLDDIMYAKVDRWRSWQALHIWYKTGFEPRENSFSLSGLKNDATIKPVLNTVRMNWGLELGCAKTIVNNFWTQSH